MVSSQNQTLWSDANQQQSLRTQTINTELLATGIPYPPLAAPPAAATATPSAPPSPSHPIITLNPASIPVAAAPFEAPVPTYVPPPPAPGTWQPSPLIASGSSCKPPHAGPYRGFPVHVHCEGDLPSRAASTDAAGQQQQLYSSLRSTAHAPMAGPALAGPPGPPDAAQTSHNMMQMASWLVPDPRRRYSALFTSAAVLGMCFVFAFMAGDYGTWLRTPAGVAASSTPPGPIESATWGPSNLAKWLKFWEISAATTFSPGYIYAWGGRYLPAVRAGQWWRLFSSFCLHSSFAHLLSNMVLFAVLAVPLEQSYGPIRTAVIFVASAFSANFLSMTFEDPCVLYVGASGAVFGFIGLSIADLLLNWDSVRGPFVRLVVMLAMLGITIAVEYLELPYMATGRVSHLSHVGGLLGGLFVSFAFLPNLKDRRFRAVRAFVEKHFGTRLPRAAPREHRSCWRRNWCLYALALMVCGVAALFLYVALPVWIWQWKLPRLTCPATPGLV